jgi:hypothetical protein
MARCDLRTSRGHHSLTCNGDHATIRHHWSAKSSYNVLCGRLDVKLKSTVECVERNEVQKMPIVTAHVNATLCCSFLELSMKWERFALCKHAEFFAQSEPSFHSRD